MTPLELLDRELEQTRKEEYAALHTMLKRPGDLEAANKATRLGGAIDALTKFREKLVEELEKKP